jgi:hypothetical protein
MPSRKITFDTVRQIGLELAGVEEGTMYGKPALKLGGKMLVCFPSHKSAEPDSLVVRLDFDRRAELLETDPETYYIKEHYAGYPCVLVRMGRIDADVLRDLLGMAYKFVSLSLRAKPRSGPGAKRAPTGKAKRAPRRPART